MAQRRDAHGTEYITLESFLKVQGMAETGGRAKLMITSGLISVNGRVDNRRGRKLRQGDVIKLDDLEMEVQFEEGEADERADNANPV